MTAFKVGDRVDVTGPEVSAQKGKKGIVERVDKYGDLYPENVALAKGRKGKLAVKADAPVITVKLDDEDRPRTFHASDLKGGA